MNECLRHFQMNLFLFSLFFLMKAMDFILTLKEDEDVKIFFIFIIIINLTSIKFWKLHFQTFIFSLFLSYFIFIITISRFE